MNAFDDPDWDPARHTVHFDPNKGPNYYPNRMAAFRSFVDFDESGCWLWTGHKTPGGYGRFSCSEVQTASMYAHRVAYMTFVGAIPEGLELDHLCRVRHCVNPNHLEAVTPRENTLRSNGPSALNARKTHCPHGHPLSGENLYRAPDGSRHCRVCQKVSQAKHLRKKAASAGQL